MDIKIRKLKVADRKRVSKMIQRLADEIKDDSFLNLISSAIKDKKGGDEEEAKAETNTVKIGIEILRLLLQFVEDETQLWFADLIDVSVDEFFELPIDTEMVIIDQIVKAEESANFFTIASRLFNKMGRYQRVAGGAKN